MDTEEIIELGEEHRDGTIYVDIEGDLWTPHPMLPGLWVVTHRAPFMITSQLAESSAIYGPYRAVLGPPSGTPDP